MYNNKKILLACTYANITQSQLAEHFCISQQSFHDRIKTDKFTPEELEKMAEVLGCKYVSYFQTKDGKRF